MSASASRDFADALAKLRSSAARRRAEGWPERRARLERLRAAVLSGTPRLLEALARDLRKPSLEARASEISVVLAELNHAIAAGRGWMRSRRVASKGFLFGARSEIWQEPKGCALVISPWNYPVQLSLAPAVSALAAGNSVLLKPSELAPATSLALAETIAAWMPDDEMLVAQGGLEEAQALLRLPFDHFFFTGGERGGKAVMAAAALQLIPATLELGGKSPAILLRDADMALAARRLLWAKFLNCGQTCVAPDFVLVPAEREAQFLEIAKKTLLGFFGADPQRSPDLGRIVNAAHWRRLMDVLQGSIGGAVGARAIAGGRADEADLYIEPTILAGVSWESAIMQDEIFGPLLPVLPYDSLEQAEGALLRRPKPLALYVFSRDLAQARALLRRLPAGGSCVNNAIIHLANPRLPFGGVGASGFGSYHGHAGFRAFSHERSVLLQRRWGVSGLGLMEPPHGKRGRRALEAAIHWAGRHFG